MSDEPRRSSTPPSRVGRYLLFERLGAGGMGEVYRARFIATAGVVKELCVKRIRAERLSRPGAVERFIEEARLSMSLTHSNIVSVFDFGRAGDEHYLAMEWVDGADLKVILDRAGPENGGLPPEVAAHLGAEVARALAYAHGLAATLGRSVVHQDVKPANILVSRAGDVKLSDFGVATLTGLGTGAPAGTRLYMAPERLRGELPHTGDDLYSLGVVIAETLGLGPQGPREPSVFDELEPPLGPLVRDLLAEDRAARPSAARQVANALEEYVSRARARGYGSPREELARLATRAAETRPARADQGRRFRTDASFVTGSLTPDAAPPGPERPAERPASSKPGDRGGDRARAEAVHKGGGRLGRWVAILGLIAVSIIVAVGWSRSAERSPSDPAVRSSGGGDELEGSERGRPQRPGETSLAAPGESRVSRASTAGGGGSDPVELGSGPASNATGDEVAAALAPERPRSRDRRTAQPRSSPDRRARPSAVEGSPAGPRGEPAVLNINAIPWAEVLLDGRPVGTTPIFGLTVQAGAHRLRFDNEPLGAAREMGISVEPAERRDIVADLRSSEVEGDVGSEGVVPE